MLNSSRDVDPKQLHAVPEIRVANTAVRDAAPKATQFHRIPIRFEETTAPRVLISVTGSAPPASLIVDTGPRAGEFVAAGADSNGNRVSRLSCALKETVSQKVVTGVPDLFPTSTVGRRASFLLQRLPANQEGAPFVATLINEVLTAHTTYVMPSRSDAVVDRLTTEAAGSSEDDTESGIKETWPGVKRRAQLAHLGDNEKRELEQRLVAKAKRRRDNQRFEERLSEDDEQPGSDDTELSQQLLEKDAPQPQEEGSRPTSPARPPTSTSEEIATKRQRAENNTASDPIWASVSTLLSKHRGQTATKKDVQRQAITMLPDFVAMKARPPEEQKAWAKQCWDLMEAQLKVSGCVFQGADVIFPAA